MPVQRTNVVSQVRSAQLLSAAAQLMVREGSQAVSMQAVANEAGVSVGLIYRYFGSKQDLLFSVIVAVLDAFAARVTQSVDAAGPDPVRRLAAAFRAFCEVIDDHRHAAVLTYREAKLLSPAERDRIKQLEVETSGPLRDELRAGIEAGSFRSVDVDLVTYTMLLAAHGWALKHWYFESKTSFEAYVKSQTALLLNALLEPRKRRTYPDLI